MVDLLIDGNSLYARSWYAVMANTNPPGTPQDAIRAALNTVFSLLNVNSDKLGDKVDRILFAWDGIDKRDKGRAPKPPEYHHTRELFMDYLSFLLNPAHVTVPKYEADDVVATAVKQSDADTVYVVSGDKDLQQLAKKNVHYYCLNKKCVLSLRTIRDKWGVRQPNQVALALAIIGDKVDNIQGIKGWGPKKTKQLFEAVKPEATLDEAFEVIESQIPAALRNDFYQDLDLTLLNNAVPGVGPALPVVMPPIEGVKALQMPEILDYYRPVFRLYHGRPDAAGDEEDVPTNAEAGNEY